jgi:hypothetical protein
LVVSDSITDPQRALSDLEEKTNLGPKTKGGPLTTATTTAVTPVPDEIGTGTTTATLTLSHTPSGTADRLTQAAPRPSLDGKTLGAIVGGCIVGLLAVGVIAFVLLRRRTQQSRSVAAAGAPQRQHTSESEYGSIALKPNDEYESTLTTLK